MAHTINWQAIDFTFEELAASTYGEDRTEVGGVFGGNGNERE